jgi:hypothetical protein
MHHICSLWSATESNLTHLSLPLFKLCSRKGYSQGHSYAPDVTSVWAQLKKSVHVHRQPRVHRQRQEAVRTTPAAINAAACEISGFLLFFLVSTRVKPRCHPNPRHHLRVHGTNFHWCRMHDPWSGNPLACDKVKPCCHPNPRHHLRVHGNNFGDA